MTALRDTALNLLASQVPDAQGRNEPTLKLLRALIEFAPTSKGRDLVCHEIIGCCAATTGKLDVILLDELANRYRNNLLIPIAVHGGKTPVDTTNLTSPASLDEVIDESSMENAKHDMLQLKKLALRRDGFRSLMTGKFDLQATRSPLVQCDPKVDIMTITGACHILPFSLARAHDRREGVRNKSDIWEIIRHFSGDELLDELVGPNINRLENVLTLGTIERTFFGRMEIWFEATDEPHAYIVRGCGEMNGIYTKDKFVRFETTNELIPLPSPRYLALHAACAQVIHACGLGGYIGGTVRDIEELSVLPEDGRSEALVFALHRVPVE